MANKVLVLGESGGGKSSSARNLDPKTTGWINTDKKEPPLQGWEEKYMTVFGADRLPDLAKSNMVQPSTFKGVLRTALAWEEDTRIQTCLLDTITHMITEDYMDNAIGKDYKGYQQMGKNFHELMNHIRESKKNWVVMGHIRQEINDFGAKTTELRVQGKMISDLVPPSYFTTVLMAYTERKDNKTSGYFRTQSLNNDPVKSPCYFLGDEVVPALEFIEPNDLALIFRKLDAFRKGILKDDLKQKDVKSIAQPDKKQ